MTRRSGTIRHRLNGTSARSRSVCRRSPGMLIASTKRSTTTAGPTVTGRFGSRAGKRYGDVTPWHWSGEMPTNAAGMTLQPTGADLDAEICFSALPADAAEQWEAALAKTGHHVFSNVKTHRMDDDVPLLIAEVNAEHMHALEVQRR